ncbi:MAG: hypothetical protein J0L75_18775, partial [Spirochaetes bacterium]|nr:hypothetical protein [Spirochaetota bacterium]
DHPRFLALLPRNRWLFWIGTGGFFKSESLALLDRCGYLFDEIKKTEFFPPIFRPFLCAFF